MKAPKVTAHVKEEVKDAVRVFEGASTIKGGGFTPFGIIDMLLILRARLLSTSARRLFSRSVALFSAN